MSGTDVITFAVLTISDTCSKDASKDRSGPRLVQLIQHSFENAKVVTDIIPDECDQIRNKLLKLIKQKEPPVSAIITTGGTGFAPRDVTPEATKQILDKECPQLSMVISLSSLQKTKFAALTRGVCGIAGNTLILNFPGSEKAVIECFEIVKDLLPHAIQLINDDFALVRHVHADVQSNKFPDVSAVAEVFSQLGHHVCPHKVGNKHDDRNSPFPMLPVAQALDIVFKTVQQNSLLNQLLKNIVAPVNIPPFRASIKDGYAMKSSGFAGSKHVIGFIGAGDEINMSSIQDDECFKINTGAPLPQYADCVIQIEDTKLLKRNKNGEEDLVEILVQPKANLDIRPIGCDLRKGDPLFKNFDHSSVVVKSILASIGQRESPLDQAKPQVAVVSTGSELLDPYSTEKPGKIYDSNTTMIRSLLEQFNFNTNNTMVIDDDLSNVKEKLSQLFTKVDFIICSGGVSMGDKDYIKPALEQMGFTIHFGRVNMKPGKPMTFASRGDKYFFGLPGNPVSAFVTFHLFVLPALRWASGWIRSKCELAKLPVTLKNESISLDPRPEYVRATVTSRDGNLYAEITGNQMSSRLQSIIGADVLVLLPGRTDAKPTAVAGDKYLAYILRHDFITKYE